MKKEQLSRLINSHKRVDTIDKGYKSVMPTLAKQVDNVPYS